MHRRSNRLQLQVAGFALLSLCAAMASGGPASTLYEGFPVAANDAHFQDGVFVANGMIVFTDDRDYPSATSGENEVYAYNLTAGSVSRLTYSPVNKLLPHVDDEYLVWIQDETGHEFDLFGKQLGSSEVRQLTDTPYNETVPDLDYPWLVYVDDRNGLFHADVNLLNVETMESRVLTEPDGWQSSPAIGGNLVAWVEIRQLASTGATHVTESSINVYNITTGETRTVSPVLQQQSFPDVDEPYIMWQDNRPAADGWDIYVYDWRTGEESVLVGGPGHQVKPRISYPDLVWQFRTSGDDMTGALHYRSLVTADPVVVIEGPDLNILGHSVGDAHLAWSNVRSQSAAGAYDVWAARLRDVALTSTGTSTPSEVLPNPEATNTTIAERTIVPVVLDEPLQTNGATPAHGAAVSLVLTAALVLEFRRKRL